jgi:hypothetical protein
MRNWGNRDVTGTFRTAYHVYETPPGVRRIPRSEGPMFKFLHAADIHLDSPLRGLEEKDEAAPVEAIRGASRRAFENLVQLALDE